MWQSDSVMKANQNTITRTELIRRIESRKGAEAIRIYAETDARLLKTGNPHPLTRKRHVASVLLGTRYAENINKLLPEGVTPFVVSPRKWGEKRESGKVVDHKGKVYLIIRSTGLSRKANKKFVEYVENGEKIEFEKIRPFFPANNGSAKQAEKGIEKSRQVEERDFSIENILAVKMRGEMLTVVPD